MNTANKQRLLQTIEGLMQFEDELLGYFERFPDMRKYFEAGRFALKKENLLTSKEQRFLIDLLRDAANNTADADCETYQSLLEKLE